MASSSQRSRLNPHRVLGLKEAIHEHEQGQLQSKERGSTPEKHSHMDWQLQMTTATRGCCYYRQQQYHRSACRTFAWPAKFSRKYCVICRTSGRFFPPLLLLQ